MLWVVLIDFYQIEFTMHLQAAKSPLELVDGFVGDVTIAIPWSSLMESNITVEIKNLEMTVGLEFDTDISSMISTARAVVCWYFP